MYLSLKGSDQQFDPFFFFFCNQNIYGAINVDNREILKKDKIEIFQRLSQCNFFTSFCTTLMLEM